VGSFVPLPASFPLAHASPARLPKLGHAELVETSLFPRHGFHPHSVTLSPAIRRDPAELRDLSKSRCRTPVVLPETHRLPLSFRHRCPEPVSHLLQICGWGVASTHGDATLR